VTHLALPGLDLLVRRKPGVPLVSIGAYRLRRTVEARQTAGLGALAVRSAGRGAGPWSADDLADAFERQGGSLGANIAADWFGFGTSALREHLGRAGALLAGVLHQPVFAPAEVERERATLADEVAAGTDDMFRHPVQLALAAAFGDHRYGQPVKGWPESVRTLAAEQVGAWHRGELAGGRTVVIAVGDVDPERAIGILAGAFQRPAAAEGPPELSRPDAVRPEHRTEQRSKAQTALAMVFPGPGRADPDRHAAMVLSAVASGLGGRLFHALRDQRSLAYTVLMSSWQRRSAGGLLTYIATSPERETEARDAMLEEAVRFGREPVSAEELEQAVNYLAGQALVQRQTSGALAGEILDAFLLGTGLDELADPAAPFRAVTREAVQEVAARCLVPALRAEGVVRGVPAD
jgi:zinc protease